MKATQLEKLNKKVETEINELTRYEAWKLKKEITDEEDNNENNK